MGSVKSKLAFRKLRNDKLELDQAVYCSTDTSLSAFSAGESMESLKCWECLAPSSSAISSSSGNDCTTPSSSMDLESTSDDDSQKLVLHRPLVTKRKSSGGCEGESLPTSDSQNNNADISSSESSTQSVFSLEPSDVERTAQSCDSTQDTSDSISSFSTLVGGECNASLFQPIPPKQSDLVWQEAVNKFHQEECGYVIPKLLSDSVAASTMVIDDYAEKAQKRVD